MSGRILTMQGWHEASEASNLAGKGGLDWTRYAEIGDECDEEVFDYFLNILPPACWDSRGLQVGEAHDYNGPGGRARYATFRREGARIVWAGVLPRGEFRLAPVVRLQCGCCGASTWGRQHWNIDKGFGLCPKCVAWFKESPKRDGELACYGTEGVNFGESLIPEGER